MGPRPLRQYYDEDVRIETDRLGPLVEPWMRHRQRFVDELTTLTEEQWATPTRCDDWDARDVVSHLITADGFWVVSLLGAAAGEPTSFLIEFDPTTSPDALVKPMRSTSTTDLFEQFRAGTDSFIAAVSSFEEPSWSALGESPLGHVTARHILAHALWDSWLHERDIFVPLGIDVPVEPDELAVATWYSLVAGAVQGGLLDDAAPVGDGLTGPVEVSLVFDDLPDLPLRVVIDQGVRLEPGGADAVPVGSAVDFVETFTGRRADPPNASLPPELNAHLERAFQIL